MIGKEPISCEKDKYLNNKYFTSAVETRGV